jgi:hypothetical protein
MKAHRLLENLEDTSNAEQRVRTFILNHLEYFLAYPKAMKVLSHEDDVLKNELGSEIAALKREYYRCCTELTEDLKRQERLSFNTRVAVLGLFGMMNWQHLPGGHSRLEREALNGRSTISLSPLSLSCGGA